MYNADDVSKICNCSKAKAYNIIRGLNCMLLKNGANKKIIISGKISKKFFHEILKV